MDSGTKAGAATAELGEPKFDSKRLDLACLFRAIHVFSMG